MKLDKVTELVVSTAETDDDGPRLTEGELQRQVVDPVIGPFVGAYRFVHDRSVAPRGKIIAARIGREGGETLVAYHTAAPYQSSGRTRILGDGTELNEELCREDSRPLIGFGTTRSYRIHVNPMDFDGKAELDAFVDEVKSETADVEVTSSPRKGLGLELLVTLVLARIGEKPQDKVVEETAEAVADSLQGLWRTWLNSLKRHTKKGLIVGQNIVIDEYDPAVELHFKDEDVDAMGTAFDVQLLKNMLVRAAEAKEAAGAVRVHFKWINRSWKLHYVQTSDGRQWLTRNAQSERQQEEEDLERYLQQNSLTGGYSLPYRKSAKNT